MKLILNIGLAVEGGPDLAPEDVLKTLDQYAVQVDSHVVLTSDTEQTLVASVQMFEPRTINWRYLGAVARALRQDCIAMYDTDRALGSLLGPKAAAWGPFNPAYFLLADGTRLGA